MADRKIVLVFIACGILGMAGSACSSASAPEPAASMRQEAIVDHVDALERSIENVVATLSSGARPAEAPVAKSLQFGGAATEAEEQVHALEKRLEAARKSLDNIASSTEKFKTNSAGLDECHWVKECVYITCCRWGAPPSDPGTVKCLEQCCGAWEMRYVCG